MIFFFSRREFLTALILRVSLMGLLQPDTLDFMSSFEVGIASLRTNRYIDISRYNSTDISILEKCNTDGAYNTAFAL